MAIETFENLESKTQAILDTLEGLEREVEEYQEKNQSITYAYINLKDASGQIAAAGKGLSEAAELFKGSDFSAAMQAIDERISQLRTAEALLEKQSVEVSVLSEKILAKHKELAASIGLLIKDVQEIPEIKHMVATLSGEISMLISKIDRIDKNTQRGVFAGKIKG